MSTKDIHITTAEELLGAPSDLGRCELVRGELVMMTPAKRLHGWVVMEIGRRLANFVQSTDLGETHGSSVGYLVSRDPDTVREPDASFMSRERLQGQAFDTYIEGAPDLAVEVLSPSNTAAEMREKMNDYFAAGCQVVWIVDPAQRSLTIHRPDGAIAILTEHDTVAEEELLPGFSFQVGDVFPKQ